MNSRFSKKHGMKDPRWTVQDNIFQYKGIIKLLEKDIELTNCDKIITVKKLSKKVVQLKNDFQENCKTLSNAIKCDPKTQNIILNGDNKLQRLCRDFHPAKTIEHLKHKIFNKRKLLDRLNVTYKRKIEELCHQKMELAQLQESKAYSAVSNATHDSKMEKISAKIQEFQIKNDTAIQIQTTYEGILEVLKKDAVYFNRVLDQLKADLKNQGKCIISATVIGQIATELVDDQKQEHLALNKCILKDYKHRINTIEESKKHLQDLQCNFKNAIRRSETVNPVINKFDEDTQIEEIKRSEKLLETLQAITHANSINEILPSIKQRLLESRALINLCNDHNKQKNDIVHKLSNAQVSYSKLQNETENVTFEYMQTKKELKKMLRKTKQKVIAMTNAWNEEIPKISQMQAAVVHLSQLCKNIKLPVKFKNNEKENLIEDLCLKLSVLMSTVKELNIETSNVPFTVLKCYEKLLGNELSKVTYDEKPIAYFADLEEFTLSDPNVPTYKSIKEDSRRKIEENKLPKWML